MHDAIDERQEGRLHRVLSAAVEAAGGGVGRPHNPPGSCYVASAFLGRTGCCMSPSLGDCVLNKTGGA